MEQVEGLLDESVAAEAYIIHDSQKPEWERQYDLSKIDFDELAKKFAKGMKRTEIEKLKAALARKISRMVELNRTRMDYLVRFQKLIDEYNAGAHNLDVVFAEMKDIAGALTAEERRHIREELSEEELALFDLLMKPAPELTDKERKQVKKVSRDLVDILKREKLVLDWRKKETTRAGVRQTIEIMLDYLPAAFSKDIYELKCDGVYQHVYDSYWGSGHSVYSGMH